jgi:predicted aspartyl protease
MNVIDYPFIKIGQAPSRPTLFIRFTSPKGFQDLPALIDTGAAQCCLPAGFAEILGLIPTQPKVRWLVRALRRLLRRIGLARIPAPLPTSGTAKTMRTAGGKVAAYVHECGLQVWNTQEYLNDKRVAVHVVPAIPVYFMPSLQEALLGVSFFNEHTLTIDYKDKRFSIRQASPP